MISFFSGLDQFRAVAMLIVMAIFGGIAISAAVGRVRTAKLFGPIAAAMVLDALLFSFSLAGGGNLVADEVFWHRKAEEAARALEGGPALDPWGTRNKVGYVWILGSLYVLSGPAPLLPVLLNLLLHAALVVIIAKTVELLLTSSDFNRDDIGQMVIWAAYITAVLPAFVWWTPNVLRETLTLTLVAGVVLCVMHLLARRRWVFVVPGAGALAVLSWIRFDLGVVVLIGAILAIAYIESGATKYSLAIRAFLVGLGLIGLPLVFGSLTELFDVSADSIAMSTAELSNTARSGFPGLHARASLLEVVGITAPRMAIGPFPWEWSMEGVMLLAMMEFACWAFIVILAARAIVNVRAEALRRYFPIFIVLAAVIFTGLVFAVGSYGILARFRPIVTVVLLPVAALGAWPGWRARETSGWRRAGGRSMPRETIAGREAWEQSR